MTIRLRLGSLVDAALRRAMNGGNPVGEGLSEAEAKARLRRFGPNVLVELGAGARLWEFLRGLADPMVLMLLATAAFYSVLGERRDAIVLAAAAVPIMGVDVLLDFRARNALKKLAAAVAARVRVVRAGREVEVPTRELVPGDLLVIREGDVLHADGVVRWAANLALDESQLTGEAEPRQKEPLANEAGGAQAAEQHRFYAGSLVLAGHGLGEILATGRATRYGAIARLVGGAAVESTPLERRIGRMARRLLVAAGAASAGIFLLMLARGTGLRASFLYAITLAIASIPEEYPLLLALFLSLGAWRLSRRGVLVRRLASVEALGSTTVICLDKTGTLTRGRYELDIHIPLNESATEQDLLEAAALACELNPADPLERAIVSHCREHGVDTDALYAKWQLAFDYPFEIAGKHMTHVWRAVSGKQARLVAKGAIEGIIEHCTLGTAERARAEAANREMAARGLRVLAVAGRYGAGLGAADPAPAVDCGRAFTGVRQEDERELQLYGLLGFQDPLRPEVAEAVAQCQQAGIHLKLITGDHALTAHAIAEAAGIQHDDEAIVTGDQLGRTSGDRLAEIVNSASLFARIRPEQKYAIVDALVRAGEVVAMTGDGINDAPALRRATIGVAMGQRGTEVAREAASLVLLRDDFGALVATVREGRQLLSTIRRAFLFVLGFKTMVIGLALSVPALGMPVLLLPVELVWLELIVHPVSALVFEGGPQQYDVMRQRPTSPEAALISRRSALRSALSGAALALGALMLYAARLPAGEASARSLAMLVVVMGSIALAWAELKGSRPWWERERLQRLRIWLVFAAVLAVLAVCTLVQPVSRLLHMGPVSALDWGLAALVVLAATGWRSFGLSKDAGA